MTFYPLEPQEWRIAATSLCPAEERIYYRLRTLNPFNSSKFKITVEDLAAELEYHCDTILRCLRNLRSYGLVAYHMYRRTLYSFEFTSPEQQSDRVESQPKQEQLSQSTVDDDRLKRSFDRFKRSFDRLNKIDPAPSKDFSFTNNRFKNLNQNIGESPENERGWFGQILVAIEESGIRANKTIQAEIDRLIREVGFAAAARRVELAIGSLEEQRAKGLLRNPGGFFKRALERCFTPNEDGYRRRSPQPPSAPPPAAPSPAAPQVAIVASAPPIAEETPINPVAIAPPRLSRQALLKFQQWVDVHLLRGDRASVLERLQSALESGYAEDVGELLWMRKDWKIHLGGSRLIDIS